MPSDSTDRYAGNAVASAILPKRSAGAVFVFARNIRCRRIPKADATRDFSVKSSE